jgi:hypothetical protein
MIAKTSLHDALRRLCDLSVEHAYDPYGDFGWPEAIPEEGLWMSPDLLSVHGTRHMDEMPPEQLSRLSRWELINFFSFNVHGIRDLMLHVLSCIHKSGYEITSEYFHHFLDEENKHMFFFAEFCKRYGGKIYTTQKVQFPTFAEENVQSFIAFAKILISEHVSDFYNVRMMNDATLHPMIRKVNLVHHQDESRHLAMGLRVVSELWNDLAARHPPETLQQIGCYLGRYMRFFVQSFYNPAAYRDAGLSEPYEWRKRLMDAPERRAFHLQVLHKPIYFFHSHAIDIGEVF